MAEATNWPSIQALGLLPTSDLLRSAGLSNSARRRIERSQRRAHTVLPNGISVRDQTRISPKALETSLVGLRPSQWYSLLNERVFFWVDLTRLASHWGACRQRTQIVLTFDARQLLESYGAFATVTPINTGNARRTPARRGAQTFVPYRSWIEFGWASEANGLGTRERSRSHKPVELTIRASIPDAMQYVVAVREVAADEDFDLITQRTVLTEMSPVQSMVSRANNEMVLYG